MKAYLEIVKLNNDVVTASGGSEPACECYVPGFVTLNAAEDDC